MDFRTVVEIPAHLPPITHAERILLLGSCFAENIGEMLGNGKFQLDINPFGILYNPSSIATALREILAGKEYSEEDLFFYKTGWHSPMHHGIFSASTSKEVLRRINVRLLRAHQDIYELDWLMITFGTSYVYMQKENAKVVANCHKLPESSFIRRRLEVEEIVTGYTSLIADLTARNPKLKVLFTVSPIRHARDGMHANQLSKSVLLLAIECLQKGFSENVFYFPSYELMLDELRDYRFYADDMLHPSALAVRYLWERFSDSFFSQETKQVLTAVEEIRRDLKHKPFNPESEAYKIFLEQRLLKIEQLKGKYPYLDFQKETELCRIRLNR